MEVCDDFGNPVGKMSAMLPGHQGTTGSQPSNLEGSQPSQTAVAEASEPGGRVYVKSGRDFMYNGRKYTNAFGVDFYMDELDETLPYPKLKESHKLLEKATPKEISEEEMPSSAKLI